MSSKIQVVIAMGSKSDLKTMLQAADILAEFEVGTSVQIVSAHRTPKLLESSVNHWERSGAQVIIAGAGGAAHLPGMLAAFSVLPVIGVPVGSRAMNGLDALLSVSQMPRGVPVATVAVDNAFNAGLLAVQILSTADDGNGSKLKKELMAYKKGLRRKVTKDRLCLGRLGVRKFLAR